MHQFRSAVFNGDGVRVPSPVASKENCRRSNGSLAGLVIPRQERRVTDQRREDRFRGIVERAVIVFRRKKLQVPVVNVSGSGVMVEADIVPRIGEKVGILFEGFDRLDGVVCWVREGRIGLDVGEGGIALG